MPDPGIHKHFTKKLLTWFNNNARQMPWRNLQNDPDPYRVWISEIMLQQTTVSTVIGYYEHWLKAFPSIKLLAEADEQKVLRQWQGLGYYNRARNLLKCARLLVEEYNGKLPCTVDGLKALPGFGPYTAAAVGSIAFGCPVPLVDANVRRVMMRILAIQDVLSVQHDKHILNQLKSVISSQLPGHFNQAMMEIGALICRHKEPLCNQCPVRSDCKAFAQSIQELIPTPKVKVIKEIEAVVAIIWQGDKVLIQQRPNKGLLAGLWEFPGGKVDPSDKSLRVALKREVFEETGIDVSVAAKLGQVVHYYTQFRVKLNAFQCTYKGDVRSSDVLKFVTRHELKKYPMPSGSAKLVDKYIYR